LFGVLLSGELTGWFLLLLPQVYVEFSDVDGATKCAGAMRNRQFANRIVQCNFFPEAEYQQRQLAWGGCSLVGAG
jgi:hypothetical protein